MTDITVISCSSALSAKPRAIGGESIFHLNSAPAAQAALVSAECKYTGLYLKARCPRPSCHVDIRDSQTWTHCRVLPPGE